MDYSEQELREVLVIPGFISEEGFAAAVKEAQEAKKGLIEVLLNRNFIKDEQLGQLGARQRGYGFINLRSEKIDEEILRLVPEVVARSRQLIAFARDEERVKVGLVDPGDLEMIHILEKRFGCPVIPYYITERDWQAAMSSYQGDVQSVFDSILGQLQGETASPEGQDQLVVRMVNELLLAANSNHASDIHIEPGRDKLIVRFRIDSIMHQVLEIPKNLSETIIMRIKIMSKMRTDEHKSAQDGKFQFEAPGETVDVRVSIVPVTGGENIVLRLLSARARQLSLSSLGISPKDLEKVESMVQNPHGMVLITGPTGSGKTTTLYAILNIINHPEINIATIEDPVEYDIPGIAQIQVNTKTNLSFAQGLRAIVRQDPDVIMVGEVRDRETAGIAINSAMTGHLVLSTLHANDAATTLPRLLDMGIEPFLVASTIKLIIAQRLVRIICLKCRASYAPEEKELDMIAKYSKLNYAFNKRGVEDLKKLRLYRGSGCKVCGGTGYSGRVGIFEILEMNTDIKELIISRSSSDQITEKAVQGGMTTMLDDGLDKVINGITTLFEIIRVTESKT